MSFLSLIKRVNKRFIRYPLTDYLTGREEALGKAKNIIPFFYFFLLYQAFSAFGTWQRGGLFPDVQFSPVWAVWWTQYLEFEQAALFVMLLFLSTALLAALFYKNKLVRILSFIGFFQYHALLSSFGGFYHGLILWLGVGFLFAFLPNVWQRPSAANRKSFLFLFWGAQAFVLLLYSMAGLAKVIDAVYQIRVGEASAFSPDALALHIADWLPRIGSVSLLSPAIISRPILGWPFFLLGALYFQLFALWAAFRPSLHFFWGAGIILFHISTFFFMSVVFIEPIFLSALLFLNSPFQKELSAKEALVDLPIFGLAFRYARKII